MSMADVDLFPFDEPVRQSADDQSKHVHVRKLHPAVTSVVTPRVHKALIELYDE